jgi:hypothetical protein
MDQKKKNISLLISLGILSLVSLFLFISGSDTGEVIDPTLFRLSNSTIVDRVLMIKRNDTTDLHYKTSGWKVNNTYEADRGMVDVLFATINQATPKREVATRLRDSVINRMYAEGVKVLFYSGANVQMEFQVWGDAESGLTYFSNSENKTPYVMVIPGYRVQVAGIFEQTSNTWRDKRIFNFNWRNFKELTAQFPRDPKQNFQVAMAGRYFSIVGEAKIDTASLNNYLDAVSLIRATQFYTIGESPSTDSLIKTSPVMTLDVKDVGNSIYSFKLFEVAKGQSSAISQWGNDYVWLNRRDILQIYKKKKDFVK